LSKRGFEVSIITTEGVLSWWSRGVCVCEEGFVARFQEHVEQGCVCGKGLVGRFQEEEEQRCVCGKGSGGGDWF